jgi:hypothetical protein
MSEAVPPSQRVEADADCHVRSNDVGDILRIPSRGLPTAGRSFGFLRPIRAVDAELASV